MRSNESAGMMFHCLFVPANAVPCLPVTPNVLNNVYFKNKDTHPSGTFPSPPSAFFALFPDIINALILPSLVSFENLVNVFIFPLFHSFQINQVCFECS